MTNEPPTISDEDGTGVSARDDYPALAGPQADAALREIDLLRADVVRLLARLSTAEAWLRVATATDVSLWKVEVPDAE